MTDIKPTQMRFDKDWRRTYFIDNKQVSIAEYAYHMVTVFKFRPGEGLRLV